MDKLFSDKEVYQKERPTSATPEQVAAFYKKVADYFFKNNWTTDHEDDVIEALEQLEPFSDNGFELAKELDDSRRASFEIDAEAVEYLDGLGHDWRKLTDENVKDWVKAHNPQPAFADKQQLIINKTIHHKLPAGAIVFVNGFKEESACYLLNASTEQYGGYIIPYEKAEECCQPQPTN